MSKSDKIANRINHACKQIKLWSNNNPEAIEVLRPDLGLRSWDILTKEEKRKIWKHLYQALFYKEIELFQKRIEYSVRVLNDHNKYHAFGEKYLTSRTFDNAYADFQNIFYDENQHIVLEMLSYYFKHVLHEKEKNSYQIHKKSREKKEAFEKRFTEWLYNILDRIINLINDVFEDFGVNVCASRQGFLPRQEPKIMENIYEPVLKIISAKKWELVSRELKNAFSDYLKKTEESYSSCITHTICTIEAFLQILNNKEIGKDKLSNLLKESFEKGTIPNDIFTKNIFKNIESILARTRQETGDAHPKKEYATEKNARLVLNLAMVFIQHCIQS